MPHGWLVIDKPLGWTSADVVGRLRGALRRGGWGRVKVGHGGTLDPLATGVLPVALGEATKLSGYLLNGDKAYEFAVAFGHETTTDDAEGEPAAAGGPVPERAAVEAVLPRFLGAVAQRPPAYSALKVAGRRAYALARAGEAVELAERTVRIDAVNLLEWSPPVARFAVRCGKGTYVRSLARDIARAAGTLGHVVELRRTASGPFTLADAMPLDAAAALCEGPGLEQACKPLTAGLDDIPVLEVEPHEAGALKQGRRLAGPRVAPGTYLAITRSVPVALVQASTEDVRVLRGLNLEGDPDVDRC